MKMKGGLIGLVVIVLALTFIGPGDVGAIKIVIICILLLMIILIVLMIWIFLVGRSCKIALHRDSDLGVSKIFYELV